ncbi:MAG: hypothetical protein AB2L14_35945 [Candidatus Xenobiia bacterium LiM19]
MQEVRTLQEKSDRLRDLLAMSPQDRMKACSSLFPELLKSSRLDAR